MSLKRPRPRAEDFTVAWISALPVELTAAAAMLDDEYEDSDDTAQYKLGRIGRHNVVIVCLPAGQIGTVSATAVAVELRYKFPAVKIGLMVGIGGGVPSLEADIRLGDVVISQPQGPHGGVVQYDFGKTGLDGFHTRTGSLNAPPSALLTAVSRLRSNRIAGRSDVPVYLSPLADRREFHRHNAGPDILYRASYSHVGGSNCNQCDKDMVVRRPRRDSEEPVIHYGTIASGNQVMKDGLSRDRLSSELGGVLCFEMEAAGLMNSLPSLVIRGICDYADSHKNKEWQPFAAAAAAACAKEILSFVPAAPHSTGTGIEFIRDTARYYNDMGRSNIPYTEPTNIFMTANRVSETTANTTMKPALTEDQRQRFLDSLRFDQIDARHATIKPAHAKTCKWLLSRSEYRDWLDPTKLSDHHGFLWIKGKPGTGKSTMMKFAFANAKKTMMDTTVISFFFNARGEELEKSTLGMYRSLLLQLLDKLPHLQSVFDLLGSTASSNIGYYRWDIESTKRLFMGAIEKIGQGCLTCFIDALDECEEDHVREMVAFFRDLGELAVSTEFRFHVCFSSRHYPHITIENGIELVLEGQEGHQQDIANYLHSELKAGRSKLVEQIKTEILERSSGIFLWVVLVVPILQKEYDHGRVSALRKRLDEIPNGLDNLFKDILTRDGQNIDELILCLQWILYAKRPLKREELYFAILAGVEQEALTAWSPDEITKEDMERRILSSSKGLTEMTRSKNQAVQFIHESVRDFLLKGSGLRGLRPDLSANLSGVSHEWLKKCCQNYLMIDTSKHLSLAIPLPSASSKKAVKLRQLASEKFPFLKYAVQNVLHHADAADGYGILQDAFLENFPLKDWITLDNLFQKFEIRRYTSAANQLYILAEKSLPNLIRIVLKGVQCMDIKGGRYGYPSHAALAHANEKAVRALLVLMTDTGSDCAIPDNDPFCSTDGEYEEVIGYLLKNRRVISSRKDRTLLAYAAEVSDLALVKVLLATRKVDINSRTKDGRTPLSWAAASGHEAVVKLLLATDRADPDSKDSDGSTPLSRAAANGHEVVVKLLLATDKVDQDSKNSDGRTPLWWAAVNGHEVVVKLLLAINKVDPDSKSSNGQTPLWWAAGNGHEAVVKLLLATDRVDPDSKDSHGQTPLLWAAANGHEAVVQLLLATDRVDPDSKDSDGRRPLWWAAADGHEAMVKLLLATDRVDPDSKGSDGRTPLWCAAANGHEAVVKLLLATDGVDPDLKDSDGWTPLWRTATNGHEAVVKLLLATDRVDPDSKDSDGQTPLWWAATNGHEAVVQLLLATDRVDLDSKDSHGRTPLWWAVGNGHEAVVQLLLATDGVDPASKGSDGQTPLWWAARNGHDAVVKLLESHTSA
jgi:ankyrin repeat protein/nucleoside phosphorylase